MTRMAVVLLAFVLGAGSAPAQTVDELKKAVAALQADVERLKAEGTGTDRTVELERRIDLLAAEIEKARTGGATEAPVDKGRPGFGPAAAKVYGAAKGVSIGGYGEALYQNFASQRQDGSAADKTDSADYLRQVLYVGYKFSDRILFNSEIEFEHASTGEGAEERGEVSVEFGYLDFKLSDRVGARAGLLLVPMGLLNELHEPPIFHGARRPQVETVVIPATWFENGLGLYGDAGPVSWRAYLVAGLNSAGFTSAAGLRDGRQSGSQSLAHDLAFTGRLDYTGVANLLVGGSVFTGKSGQGARLDGAEVGARVTLVEAHAQYQRRGFELRALLARGTLGDAALVNRSNGFTGSESVGKAVSGWYAQAAYDVMSLSPRGRWAVTPFVRYEKIDTQDGVPAGFSEDPATDRNLLTLGVGVKPLPNVVLKADYQREHNAARTGTNQWNLALGYLF